MTMGFRFQRRLRILPGVTINVSKSAVSVTAGVKGAHVTAGTNGARVGASLPGTGLSWNERVHTNPPVPTNPRPIEQAPYQHHAPGHRGAAWVVFAALFVLFLLLVVLPRIVGA
jgi:hypothetical protein